ncbi:cytochrome P450 [Xylaria arbuscula]|nr:cytochrome P450 [Xylaria arbuscula]
MNRALVYLIEPLNQACLAACKKEIPSCPEWKSVLPYPLIIKIFAGMSACAMVGPELGTLDSEWQSLSMRYVEAALSAPGIVKVSYPTWLYWLSQYTNKGVKTMWKLQTRASELLAPVLQARIAATEEVKEKGRKIKGRRKYEDGVQWLYDAHTARGKVLTPVQLARDLFVMMTASIHSTSGAGLSMLFDLMETPEVLSDIREEIARVQSANPTWTRRALGELRLLDSFMRESARIHALTQYTAVQRIPTEQWTFKDGLTIPAGITLAFPSYHHNFDPEIHANPEMFDPRRHLRKRKEIENTHRYHFASASTDMMNWGSGRHACPGRFFAQETLKLMLVHLLTHYEFKHADDQNGVPRFISRNMFTIPNPVLPILMRERKTAPY